MAATSPRRRCRRSCASRCSGWRSRREAGPRRRARGGPSGGWSARGVLIESAAMKLAELLEGVAGATVRGDPATEIRGLACHTRDVADGTLFFCVPGTTFDGHAKEKRAVGDVTRVAGEAPYLGGRVAAHGGARDPLEQLGKLHRGGFYQNAARAPPAGG